MVKSEDERAAGLSPQCKRVIDYMRPGRTLTNMVAITCLGVGSLSSRVAELRRAGYKVEGEWAEDRFGRQYLQYRLADGDGGK